MAGGGRRCCLAVLTASVLDFEEAPVWSLALSALSELPRLAPTLATGTRILSVWQVEALTSGASSDRQWVSLSHHRVFEVAYERSLEKLAHLGAKRVEPEAA